MPRHTLESVIHVPWAHIIIVVSQVLDLLDKPQRIHGAFHEKSRAPAVSRNLWMIIHLLCAPLSKFLRFFKSSETLFLFLSHEVLEWIMITAR